MSEPPRPALISVHDVMPATLPQVRAVMARLEARGLGPVTLLVTPGLGWDEAGLGELRTWQAAGHRLAGHGWRHEADRVEGWYHRLHSGLVSRGVAEHLALSPAEAGALMQRCFAWFAEQGLGAPEMYVPPAWAMGRVSRQQMRDLPFRWYETLAGIYDSEADRMHRVPVVGFEADTAMRAGVLGLANRVSHTLARWRGRPVRIAIHPHDLELRLAGQLADLLEKPLTPTDPATTCATP